MDLEDVEYQLSKAKLLGCKGTTGTQASFLELFEGDHEKCKKLDRRLQRKWAIVLVLQCKVRLIQESLIHRF